MSAPASYRSSAPVLSSRPTAVARRIVVALMQAVTVWKSRREVETLLTADATMLRDIGLTPMDIQCALAEPMWRDPSARLLVWSIERRAASRAAVRDNLGGLSPLAPAPRRETEAC